MDAIVNLKHEPKLREAFEYAHVHNNTVLIDRRTKWGNPFRIGRDGTRDEVIARYRADLWRRIRAGEIALEELAQIVGCWYACWCSPTTALPWTCAGTRRRVGGGGPADPSGESNSTRSGGRAMTGIAFRRMTREESRIYSGGDLVGEVYRQDDILKPGSHYYMIWLDEDWRGPVRVHERSRIREVTERLVSTHPFWG